MIPEFARDVGATLSSQDDTTAAHVALSASAGVVLAELPNILEAADVCQSHGIKVMVGAPNLVRGSSHSGNASASALADANRLDIVSLY